MESAAYGDFGWLRGLTGLAGEGNKGWPRLLTGAIEELVVMQLVESFQPSIDGLRAMLP
jgi:hypothetical protein